MLRVGYTLDVRTGDDDITRVALPRDFATSIETSGAVPIGIAPMGNAALRAAYDACDALVMPGGPDVDPARYGALAHRSTLPIHPDVDEAELQLLAWALDEDKPVLCICRGMQLLNVIRGGTLIQDLPTRDDATGALAHRESQKDQLAHEIAIERGSRLAAIAGTLTVGVNTFHHQAIDELGRGLVVTARSSDGVIEAVEDPHHRFAVGVQFHPETLGAVAPWTQKLFSALLDAVDARILAAS